MVEGYCANKVVAYVSPNDVVEKVLVNETEVSINSCSGTSHECPCAILVMWQRAIRMMKEGDGY